jgi:predicted nuclease of predicted toxin-antitoxin system
MKFLADMGISPRTVTWLKNQSYDAIHLNQQGLEKLPDEDILIKAKNESRIILTVDLDFGSLLAMSKSSLPSVILFRLGNQSRNIIESRLTEILDKCQDDLLKGAIISVNEDGFRIRSLPI